MRSLDQPPAEVSGGMPLNHFLIAKTGQLSLMDTVYSEPTAPELPVVLPETGPPTDPAA
ncbi:MAG TPA: hypothetical protein VFH99_02505 [Candidatus Saccharimonadales bacterium]|nr:hypothetical protein [Candidatus Saccharimonadales bacterium]